MLIERAVMAAAAMVAMSGTPSGPGDRVVRIYDAKDLSVMMGPPAGGSATIAASENGRVYVPRGGVPAAAGPELSGLAATMDRLFAATGVSGQEVSPGLFVVVGEAGQHEALTQAVDQLRAAQGVQYAVELAVFPVSTAQTPLVGSGATLPESAVRIAQPARRGVPAMLSAGRTVSYISDWTPVVADHTVGYDPQVSEAADGVNMTAVLSAGAGGMIGLDLRGSIAKTKIDDRFTGQVLGDEKGLPIGLATVETRLIVGDLTLTPGQATVVAVVPGFEGGQSLVVCVTARETGRETGKK